LARYHVGMDVGKVRHHACVYDTQTDTYSKVLPFSVDRVGFQDLLIFLKSLAPQKVPLGGARQLSPAGFPY
jgi:hypothetical protein